MKNFDKCISYIHFLVGPSFQGFSGWPDWFIGKLTNLQPFPDDPSKGEAKLLEVIRCGHEKFSGSNRWYRCSSRDRLCPRLKTSSFEVSPAGTLAMTLEPIEGWGKGIHRKDGMEEEVEWAKNFATHSLVAKTFPIDSSVFASPKSCLLCHGWKAGSIGKTQSQKPFQVANSSILLQGIQKVMPGTTCLAFTHDFRAANRRNYDIFLLAFGW